MKNDTTPSSATASEVEKAVDTARIDALKEYLLKQGSEGWYGALDDLLTALSDSQRQLREQALVYAQRWDDVSQAVTQEISILHKDHDQIIEGNCPVQDQAEAEKTRLVQAVKALERVQRIVWPGCDMAIRAAKREGGR